MTHRERILTALHRKELDLLIGSKKGLGILGRNKTGRPVAWGSTWHCKRHGLLHSGVVGCILSLG